MGGIVNYIVLISLEKKNISYTSILKRFMTYNILQLKTLIYINNNLLLIIKNFYKEIQPFFSIYTYMIEIDLVLLIPSYTFIIECFFSDIIFIWYNIYRFFKTQHINLTILTTPFLIHYLYKAQTTLVHILIWYKSFRTILIAMINVIIIFIILIDYYYINIIKQVGLWIVVGLLFFWLISGFNFFIKRYRYGKFTSAILRFWKRTNAVFWLIEGFLFSLFFYYYINSSQEPLYFYDSSSLNHDYLSSLPNMFWTSIVLIILIWYSYFILLQLAQYTVKQHILNLTVITLGLIYIFLLESYQFYYVISLFYENIWGFDFDTNIWTLEIEIPRLRVKHQYLLLALMAKYWHFIFIFLSWLFFIFKSYEQRHVNYIQLSWSVQNLLILFGLNILFIIQWIKWLVRRYYDIVYYWFFTDTNMFSIEIWLTECNNLISTFL